MSLVAVDILKWGLLGRVSCREKRGEASSVATLGMLPLLVSVDKIDSSTVSDKMV